jgi:hypothetical protein
MNLIKPYRNINDTLRGFKRQVIDSIPYAYQTVPEFNDPRELWTWLKPQLHFINDNDSRVPGPKKRELLQTMQTLMAYDGEGDCDCFVITTLACCIVNGWDGLRIVLVGRDKRAPVHIYTAIYWKGKRIILDFTNQGYNFERPGTPPYKFRQEIPVRWKNWNLQI